MNIEELVKLDLEHMTRGELLKYFPYEAELSEQVYDSLMGFLLPEYRLAWVENIFVPGQTCYEEYMKMRAAYERLRDRLGVQDEDEDVEIIVDALLDYGKTSALEMFKYGRKCQKMLDSK